MICTSVNPVTEEGIPQSAIQSGCIDIAASMNVLISGSAHSFGLVQFLFCKHGHREKILIELQ